MDCNAVFDEQETMRRMESYIYCEKTSATKVLLVGAGCSSFDLITMRGLRAIRQAQVLVYDDLIDQRLFISFRNNALLLSSSIYVLAKVLKLPKYTRIASISAGTIYNARVACNPTGAGSCV